MGLLILATDSMPFMTPQFIKSGPILNSCSLDSDHALFINQYLVDFYGDFFSDHLDSVLVYLRCVAR